jgi:sugar phosphate isomerase/epimerase
MDQLLFAVYSKDLREYRRRAETLQCGLELHIFSEPSILTGDLEETLNSYKRQLKGFSGPIGLHGAFYDMVPASLDPEIVAVARRRFRQSLDIAEELGARYVVFHDNYMGGWRLVNYRHGWIERQIAFWVEFSEEIASYGQTVLLENMWADDPHLLADVLQAVGCENLRACLDVAHATLYSSRPIADWLRVLEPYIYCCHMNNNDGELDLHWPLNKGVIDYKQVLEALRRLSPSPLMSLEMQSWESIASSLSYFNLSEPA